MNSILEQLKSKFDKALVAAFGQDLAKTDPMVVPASNPQFGDYQCNVAMSLAKKLQDKPRTIATKIIENLSITEICYSPEIAWPGFINLTLKPEYLKAHLKNIIKD